MTVEMPFPRPPKLWHDIKAHFDEELVGDMEMVGAHRQVEYNSEG